jgi:hypothetical protein
MQRPQFLSEHQKRIVLLGHLGWKVGLPLTEYAKVIQMFWFGTHNGSPIPGRSPLQVPSKKIAEFIVHYAPSHLVSNEVRKSVQMEYRIS